MAQRVSIGLPGTTPPDVLAALVPRIEAAGIDTLWLNDTPEGDSLAGLKVAASVTGRIALGAGIIPVDRRPVGSFDLSGLPTERLAIGVGAGRGSDGLHRVLDAVTQLRSVTDARLFVGALGPRMRRLAAEHADGVLLNWLTPSAAAEAMADLSRDANGRAVRGSLYVRTILHDSALKVLNAEAARYESIPSYLANFERLGIRAIDATIRSAHELAAYAGRIDEVVLRAITPHGSLSELEWFVEQVARFLSESSSTQPSEKQPPEPAP